MKLTPQVKTAIDSMTLHQIQRMFRFHPTNITSGESGRYMQYVAGQKAAEQNGTETNAGYTHDATMQKMRR